jgi:hypothetical protein
MLLQVMGLLSHITHIAFGTSVCSPGQDSSKTLEQKKLPPEEAAKLKVQAQGFEDTLKLTPEDQASLEVCHLLLSTWMFKWLQFCRGEIATLVEAAMHCKVCSFSIASY